MKSEVTQVVFVSVLRDISVNPLMVSEAIELYQQSLEIQKAIGNQNGIATTLAMLGETIAVNQGDFDTALDYLQQSEAILRHIGSLVTDQVVGIIEELRMMN